MSKRSAARGTAAASSIRLTLRTSTPSRQATPAPRAASCFAKEAVRQGRPEPPPLPFRSHPSPRLRQIKGGGLQSHQPSRPQEFLMGGEVSCPENRVSPEIVNLPDLRDRESREPLGAIGQWRMISRGAALSFGHLPELS